MHFVMLSRLLATILRPFTKVRPEEAATVALMTMAAFLLLTAYYLLKTVREPLILLEGGAEVKLYARAGQAFLMAGVVYIYGELARRVGRVKLLAMVFLFFASNLAIFTALAQADVQIGLAFFLWVGVFSYTVVAQFWALAADTYSEEQGKRLFPIIGAGSSVGAVVGARLAQSLVPFGPATLMGTSLIILFACVGVVVWVQRRAGQPKAGAAKVTQEAPLSKESAIHLLVNDKYLLLIGGLVILLNWVNSTGEYLLDRTLLVAATEASAHGTSPEEFIGAFKGNYFAWYNAIGMVLQLFAVSRILRLVGVRYALLVMPVFALLAYGAAVLFPVLAVMRLVKIGENSLQYSLQDTTRHALFLVASRAEKFVGKTAVDTVAVRLGAIMAAIMVIIGTSTGWSLTVFAIINVSLAALWTIVAIAIGRENRRRSEAAESEERGAGDERGAREVGAPAPSKPA